MTISTAHRQAPAIPNSAISEDRILFVDDDQTTRKIMTALLEKAGLKIDGVGSGAEALRLMQDTAYSILVIDYRMPEMNGIELASLISASGSGGTWQPVPPTLIAISGSLSESERKIAQSVFDEIIIKPIKASALESALRAALKKRAAG